MQFIFYSGPTWEEGEKLPDTFFMQIFFCELVDKKPYIQNVRVEVEVVDQMWDGDVTVAEVQIIGGHINFSKKYIKFSYDVRQHQKFNFEYGPIENFRSHYFESPLSQPKNRL